jgi:transposase
MLYAGLDLSRKRLDYCVLDEAGALVERAAVPPDRDGLGRLAGRVDEQGQAVFAAVESMNGARFVHDLLEGSGWRVEIADAAGPSFIVVIAAGAATVAR